MGLWATFKTLFVVHLLLGVVFVGSGLIVNFCMLLTYLLFWSWNKSLYRKIICHLSYSHWSIMTWLAQWWSGSTCTLYFEDPEDLKYIGREHTICVMNHKYDIDWLMAWMLSERFQMLGGTKIYGKSTLKLVPLIGWAWIFCECIFLKRQWDHDKTTISRDLQYIVEYPKDYWVTLLLFPEGTRFTDHKHQQSMEVAKKKGLPLLKHHLLPRTKGFVHSVFGVKGKIPAILDLTMAFRSDGASPTFKSILSGKPCKAEVFGRRIPLDTVPTDTEEACSAWLHKLFQEKDEIYDDFVKHGTFQRGKKCEIPRRYNDLLMFLFWFVLLALPLAWYLLNTFIYGSFYARAVIATVTIGGYIGVRMMIALTEIEKGSSYGKYGKQAENRNDKSE